MLEHSFCNLIYSIGKSYCDQCGKMIELASIENFEVFGIEPSFVIDRQTLEANYLKLQQIFHPDRYSKSIGSVKEIALKNTIKINEIYKILKSDSQRAEYLLNLLSPELAKEGNNFNEQEFLIEEFSRREEMMEADREELINLLKTEESRRQEIIVQLSDLFAKAEYHKISNIIVKLKYIEKFLKDLKLRT